MKKIIAVLFILIGVLLIAYTPLRQLYDEHEKNKLIEMYENDYLSLDESEEQLNLEENESISDFYNYFSGLQAVVENNNSSENSENNEENLSTPVDKEEQKLKNVIGLIEIGKIDIKLPIKKFVSEEQIWSSVGHLPGTANPGEAGNCVIAGHRSRKKGKLFNRLDEL